MDLTLRDFSNWLSDRADAASLLITPKASEEQHQPRARSSEDRRHVTDASATHCFSISIQEAENKLLELVVTERKEFAMKNRLCFNCLRQHHRIVKCRIKPSCIKCKGKHHTVLHGVFGASAGKQLASSQEEEDICSFGCQSMSTKQPVQLMTLVAVVRGVDKRARVRVFLDLGSQASFISAKLVSAIQPRLLECKDVSVRTFGAAVNSL